jgi:hypothetical protein
MNLLIALSTKGLIGAAFPTTGIPEIPKPPSTHLDPAVHVVGGNSSGINPLATLKTAVAINERMNQQWLGTLTWQGTDATLSERREVSAQVTATVSKGDPCAFFMEFLFIDDMYLRTYPDGHQHGQKSCHLRLLDLRCQWMSYTTGWRNTALLKHTFSLLLGRMDTVVGSWSSCSGIKAV